MDEHPDEFAQFFAPNSIAIVGVPRKDDRFGGGSFLKKFIECGFPGALYPINPKAEEIQGLKTYSDLASLPERPELTLISVTARHVPAILDECASLGLRHIHILSSGFKETGTADGKNLEQQVAHIAREHNLLVIGPNCMGPYCPAAKLTAWGAIPGMSGPVGIISQSGGITQRLTEYLYYLGIGVEKAVSIGNAAVLDSTDYLQSMAQDEKIRVIAMYLESVGDGRKLLRTARDVNLRKPIIIWKGGETEAGASTVASHTGTLAGQRRIWEAFFRQTGAIRVRSMNQWVDAIMTLSLLPAPTGKSVFLIGGGGGNSVANSDTCIREGLEVPRLATATMERLRQTVPVAGSIAGNPLDMWRIFEDVDYLLEILELAYRDSNVAMIILDRLIPRKAFHSTGDAKAAPQIIELIKKNMATKPTVITADSEGGDPDLAAKGTALRAQFSAAGIPSFPSLRRAAWSLVRLCRYHSVANSAQELQV
jgi:acyl-CoA synthetase (NDP forming)